VEERESSFISRGHLLLFIVYDGPCGSCVNGSKPDSTLGSVPSAGNVDIYHLILHGV
jgi:hypothetical protein